MKEVEANKIMEELIDINGKNIFVKIFGTGEPIFFLHSSLLTSAMWENQIEYFPNKGTSKNRLFLSVLLQFLAFQATKHAFLSGSSLKTEVFRDVHKYLTIAYDFCGHGKSALPKGSYSDYEDLKALIDEKYLSKIILIGCSYGGSVALDFTLKYPEYVLKLKYCEINDCGHLPNMEKNKEVNKIIEEYLYQGVSE